MIVVARRGWVRGQHLSIVIVLSLSLSSIHIVVVGVVCCSWRCESSVMK